LSDVRRLADRESQEVISWIVGLIRLDSNQRRSAKEAMDHPWFRKGEILAPEGYAEAIDASTATVHEGLVTSVEGVRMADLLKDPTEVSRKRITHILQFME